VIIIELFKLFGSILVDNKDAEKSISSTDKKAGGLGETLTKVGGFALKAGAVAGTAFVAAGGAALGLAKKVGDAADRLLDLNSITGMSTDEIQRWERVTKVAGVSTEAMTNASQKLTKSLDTIINSGGKGAESLSSLGLSIEQISGMNADERMNAIATALSGVDDKTERAKLGTDLLGKSWAEIAPIVDLGAEAMDKAKNSANIISEDDLKKANDFRIKMAEMGDKIAHVGMMLGVKLLPIAEKFFAWVEKAMPYIEKAVDVAFEVISVAIETVIVWIEKLIDWGKVWVEENQETVEKIKDGFMRFFEAVKGFFEGFISIVSVLWEQYGEYIVTNISTVFTLVKNIIGGAFNIITDIFSIFAALFKGDWAALWEGVKSLFSNIITLVVDVFGGALDLVINQFKAFGAIFNNIWEGIKTGIAAAVNFIIGKINAMIGSVTSAINTVTSLASKIPGINIPTLTAPKIPGLAEGGTVTRSGSVLVGENAPEILNLPRGASVTPLNKAGGVNIYISGNSIMGDRDADRFGELIVGRLKALGVT
jgi:hypothetical protein